MFSLTEDDLPEKGNIQTIENEIKRLVEECLAGQIQTWLQETSNGGISEFMTEQLRNECSIIESDCIDIDNIILGQSISPFVLGMTSTLQSERDNISFTTDKVALLATFPLWAPFTLVLGLIAIPIGIGYYTVSWIKNRIEVKDYKQNKQKYVKNISDKMMGDIDITFLMEKVFGQFLNEIDSQIDQFCESTIPRRILSGEILVKRIKTDIRQPVEIRKQCILLENDFKSAYGRVLYIYMEYFDMFKLNRSHVRKKELHNEFEVFVNGEWIDTVVKQMKWSYSNNADCSILSEIQILR